MLGTPAALITSVLQLPQPLQYLILSEFSQSLKRWTRNQRLLLTFVGASLDRLKLWVFIPEKAILTGKLLNLHILQQLSAITVQ